MKPLVSRILQIVVGIAFGYAAVVKILDPQAFLSSVLTFKLVPYTAAAVASLYLPWLELVLAACLIVGRMRRAATWLTSLLLIVFVGLVAQARVRGLTIDCGCFGANRIGSDYEYAWKIGENLVLLAILWAGWLLGSGKPKNQ